MNPNSPPLEDKNQDGIPDFDHPEMIVHESKNEKLSLGQKISDLVTEIYGSWNYIIFQTILVIGWIIVNIGLFSNPDTAWDPYPYVFLNFIFSAQSAYAAPIIMMAQNRQSEKDRLMAKHDLHADLRSIDELKNVQKRLIELEEKLLIALNTQQKKQNGLIKTSDEHQNHVKPLINSN